MQRKRLRAPIAYRMLSIAGIASLSMAAAHADNDDGAFLPRLVTSSTIPANGDLNPYGVAFVPQNFPASGSIAFRSRGRVDERHCPEQDSNCHRIYCCAQFRCGNSRPELAYDNTTGILYVASTADNQIFAVQHAGQTACCVTKGTPIFEDPKAHLRGPLALVLAPNGDLLTANSDAVNGDTAHPSEIVEFTKSGEFVRQFNVDASQGGAFGIATVLSGYPRFNFAAVDDVPNTISVYSLP
jgi:hypothetical protein